MRGEKCEKRGYFLSSNVLEISYRWERSITASSIKWISPKGSIRFFKQGPKKAILGDTKGAKII